MAKREKRQDDRYRDAEREGERKTKKERELMKRFWYVVITSSWASQTHMHRKTDTDASS